MEKIDTYEWSNHKAYTSVAKKWTWLHKKYILSLFSKNRKDRLRYYRRWVTVEDEDEVSRKIDGMKWPSFLGPAAFVDRIKERFFAKQNSGEVPSSKELLPEAEKIVEVVAEYYSVTQAEILKKHRGRPNEARSAAIYLTRKLRRDTLKQIGHQFQIDRYSTVSSSIERTKKNISTDRKLARQLGKLADLIVKSQKP